jgi:uncharacterized heparinase superfamily protein
MSAKKYVGDNTFNFLNLSEKFEGDVDWNFQGDGKLWNYNLQYFDYLHDALTSENDKQRLIEDFAGALLNKKVKPEPYPVSLRLINWVIYYSKTGYSSPLFERALKYQVDYLESNLEYHLLANHLLENYFALLVCGYCLHDVKLTMKALRLIEKELKEQVLKDGAHYERSPMYHCIILSRLLMIIDIVHTNRWISLDSAFLKLKAEAMLQWLKTFSFDDGTYPHFNDSTNGVAPAAPLLFEYATTLALGANKGKLEDSGYRKFALGNYEVVADAGKPMPSYQPGHSHSNMMSFCVNHKNSPFLTDTGISTYEKNARRQFERSTSAHNCVVIDQTNQSEVWGGFRVGKRAEILILKDEASVLSARHNGYLHKFKCMHEREFKFSDENITIFDLLTNKTLLGTTFFYLDHSIRIPEKKGKHFFIQEVGSVHFLNASKEEVCAYEQAVGFNKKEKSYCIKVYFQDHLTTTIQFQ